MKPRSRKSSCVLASTLLLSACASLPVPDYAGQHPANPDAIQAPASTLSSALDTYRIAPAERGQPGDPADQSTEDGHEHR